MEPRGVSGAGGSPTPSGPYPSQACLDKANALLAQMTPNEKYAQMMQMERAALTPAMVTQYGIGSAFSQGGSGPATNTPSAWADMTDAYEKAALASRLKIPIIYGADEVHGVGTVAGATVFPHNIGIGATRDVALAGQIAQITTAEALGVGVRFLFSPVVAVALNERWGRTYEAFGETTDLATTMGAAITTDLQFTATGATTGILACAKHYLGDGGTLNGSNGGVTAGDEAALEAIHLTPYRAAVAAHVGLDHGVVQHLADHQDAHQQADDHRHPQGDVGIRRHRDLRLQCLFSAWSTEHRRGAAAGSRRVFERRHRHVHALCGQHSHHAWILQRAGARDRPAIAHRRRCPPHRGRQVRARPVFGLGPGRSVVDRAGGLRRAPSGGAQGRAGVAGGPEEHGERAAAGQDRPHRARRQECRQHRESVRWLDHHLAGHRNQGPGNGRGDHRTSGHADGARRDQRGVLAGRNHSPGWGQGRRRRHRRDALRRRAWGTARTSSWPRPTSPP